MAHHREVEAGGVPDHIVGRHGSTFLKNCRERMGHWRGAGVEVNVSADEIGEYIDRLNFWIDTRETSDDKAIKVAFLSAVGKEAFTLMKTLVYPKTLW